MAPGCRSVATTPIRQDVSRRKNNNPKKLREGFEEGTPFAVIRDRDTILLKPVKLPGIKEFEALVEKGVKIAKIRKIKESDVDKTVHRHRAITA